jgi:purine-binding chemotaxis protein CheW
VSGDIQSGLHGLVVFRLAGQGFALPVEAVAEVVPIAELGRPPQMPAAVEGILNLAGRAVPVLRLDRLLGMADGRYGLAASILVMRGARPVGLLVEHVDGVRNVGDLQFLPVAAADSFNGCVVAELVAEPVGSAALWHLLSWDRLLLEEERRRLGDFAAREQERLAESWGAAP